VTLAVPATDPVARHVLALERALRGPARVRRSMIREVRDGLHDAVAAYRDRGLDHNTAAEQAVRDFGPIGEIAPQLQEELVARQGRWTALLVMVTFPGLVLAWDAVWRWGPDTGHDPVTSLTVALARVEDVAAIVIGIVGVVLLVAGSHRAAPQRLVTRLAAGIACAGAVICAGAAVLMNLASGPAAAAILTTNPYTLPAFVGSGLLFLVVMWTAVRAFRVARMR
jgi:hypothetical protein